KFNGLGFKRWQQKMLFYLITLNLSRFLTEDVPKLKEGELNAEYVSAVEAWNHSDFLCRNLCPNGLADVLYNVFYEKKTAKELWESLDRKYKTEDAGPKKSDIHAEGKTLSESFQVAVIIEKLPPAWKEFKIYLKHKRKSFPEKRSIH
ncbi:hypothetical protein F511_44572, partial [Dorcoceras hygrometricum]